MAFPRVSILIPTHNRADYLSTALDSAFHQTFSELEIIVVDDGSTDNTAEVLCKYTDSRLQLIRQKNHGVSAALNTAWRAAHGEFVAMLGSDDEMLPQQVETLLNRIEREPSFGMIYGRAQAMDAHGNSLPQLYGTPLKFPNDSLSSILYANCVCTIAALTRRALIEQAGGFNENLLANEDWDLWIRLAERCQFGFCDEILARYRLHPQSLTGSGSRQYETVVAGRIGLIERYFASPRVPPNALAIKSLALRNVYMDATIRYLTIGKQRAAFSTFLRALGSGSNPFSTALRVVGVALFDLYLSKTTWGVRLTDALVKQRRAAWHR